MIVLSLKKFKNSFLKKQPFLVVNEESKEKKTTKKYRKQEQNLVNACIEYLTWMGCFVFRNNTGAIVVSQGNSKRIVRFGIKGSPDIIGCAPDGRFIAVECKSSKGKLSEHQKEFIKKIEQCGGLVFVVRSIDELKELFFNYKNKLKEEQNDSFSFKKCRFISNQSI